MGGRRKREELPRLYVMNTSMSRYALVCADRRTEETQHQNQPQCSSHADSRRKPRHTTLSRYHSESRHMAVLLSGL